MTTNNDADRDSIETLNKTIAPAETDADQQDVIYYLERLFANAYPTGTTLRYHEYELTHTIDGVWSVQHEDATNPVDVLNLAGFQSADNLHAYLDALAKQSPTTHAEWHDSAGERDQ